MKICVLSGSPKGKYSITYQTVRFLQIMFPMDEFEIMHVGHQVRTLEKNISPVIDAINRSELLLFCYPVYTFIVPYQLHRTIELLKESGCDISGHFAAQICTSKHFYDITAINFIKENCIDMGLKYVGELSADMDDLLSEKGQNDAVAFWKLIHFKTENMIFENSLKLKANTTQSVQEADVTLNRQTPSKAMFDEAKPLDIDAKKAKSSSEKTVAIVGVFNENDTELMEMTEDFCSQLPYNTKIINLNEFKFSGGCLGCFNCATNGKCIYKDGFDSFLRDEIQTSDAIVYAFRIKDHSMGSRMKLYDDRQFCNGHRTVTSGMPVGYLVKGELEMEANLQMIIKGRSEVGGNFLAGVATDKESVTRLAQMLEYALEQRLTQPAGFLGVGGTKIFRDLIWVMQGMMKADHKFYKSHGMYDFPQKQKGRLILMKLVGGMISNPKIKSKMGNMMNEGMLMPYQKVFDKLDKNYSRK